MSQGINILSIAQNEVTGEILDSCAELYCKIWREPPWNEDFWKEEEVKADILGDCKKEAADCYIATLGDSGRAVGFTWGYMVTPLHLNEISGTDYFTLAGNLNGKTFYVDELGVDASCRGHGVGKHLSGALVKHAINHGAQLLVLRTDEKALAARTLYKKLGFIEIPVRDAKYPGRTYWHLKI